MKCTKMGVFFDFDSVVWLFVSIKRGGGSLCFLLVSNDIGIGANIN